MKFEWRSFAFFTCCSSFVQCCMHFLNAQKHGKYFLPFTYNITEIKLHTTINKNLCSQRNEAIPGKLNDKPSLFHQLTFYALNSPDDITYLPSFFSTTQPHNYYALPGINLSNLQHAKKHTHGMLLSFLQPYSQHDLFLPRATQPRWCQMPLNTTTGSTIVVVAPDGAISLLASLQGSARVVVVVVRLTRKLFDMMHRN